MTGCGCGAGAASMTPRPAGNPPGRSAITYRAGDHARFLATMLTRLAAYPELDALRTRDPGDFAVALLDCWAVVADVTTFYTERLANEGYLGTATDPASLLHLARLVDHRPRPALGSSVELAFTLQPDAVAVVPAGTQARSVPGQGELPQAFETGADLPARADWNTLAVRTTQPAATSADSAKALDTLTIAGTAANLRAGDRLLFVFGGADVQAQPQPTTVVRTVASAIPDFAAGRTAVQFVPSDLNAQQALRDRLGRALARVLEPVPAGAGTEVVLEAVVRGVEGIGRGLDYAVLARLVSELAEADALVRARASQPVLAWLDTAVARAAALARTALAVVSTAQRRSPPEIEYLRELAVELVCPPNEGDRERGRDPACAAAVPLVTAAAVLPALRRPPARPAAVPPDPQRLFAPQSDVQSALLAAADPRLAPVLRTAIGNQAVTPPPATTAVLALRVAARSVNPNAFVGDDTTKLLVEGTVDTVTRGSWLLTEQVDNAGCVTSKVTRVTDVARLRQPVSPRPENSPEVAVPVTLLTVNGAAYTVGDPTNWNGITAYGGGEPLTPVEIPITDPVGGDRITLARMYDGLEPGRLLAISGERTDIPGTPGIQATELAIVAGVEQAVDPARPGDPVRPTLLLATPLAYTYRRDTVTVLGNVVSATQGETRSEVLGSGDAGQPGQSFVLRQVTATAPLTRLPSAEADGARPELTVRVDGVAWSSVDSLVDLGPTDPGYVLADRPDGSVAVAFGDGRNGARPATGVENITARYRLGAGPAGNVATGQVTQLAARPLGVTAVTNPIPATGGARADGPDDLRAGIPRRTLALDRLVSVADYEAFALARAGVGKASARRLFDGDREIVHLTLAGVDDAPLDPSDALVTKLRAALAAEGDPHLPVAVAVRDLVTIVLSAGVKVLPGYAFELVEPAVRAAALRVLGFAQRDLGAPADLSAVVAALQAVPGVDYLDIDVFAGIPATGDPVALVTAAAALTTANPVVPAAPAVFDEVIHTVGPSETLSQIVIRSGIGLDEIARLNPGLTSVTLAEGTAVVVFRGIRPAQLAVLSPDIPATLTLRRIP